ncbi:hypothetical protein DH2020_041427 [Rehmannia glutinosa]|uniref:Disease resistance protein n=1 Tax=Rehmannia glutinosa TaxID=99300 RepID=A0ABR0US39_REHGL
MAEIAAIVANLLGPAMELGSYVVTPIKHQFNYLCCFTSNVQNLREEAKTLNDARDRLQQQVDVAKRNTEVIFPEVETWITSAKKIQVHISRIEIDIPKVQRTFLNMKSRFSLSKKAKKTTNFIKKLQDSCMFGTVSLPAPPASIKYIPFGQIYEFESRKQIEEDIMATLRDNKVTMVGICGMGGVGKTSIAKRIINRVREEHLYDEVVMVIVSKQVDMLKIQHEIAELLGLKLEVESISARVHKLRARLMGTRGTLMVLDDVWGTLKLEDLGIPCEKCTVLLTSRDRGCFDTMDVQKIYVMQILSKKEAWFLFKEKVGPCVNDLSLLSIAKNIVGECKGLPIALVTVGRALKDKKNILVWRDALLQLKSGNPVDMPDVIARVYNPLKLSYDSLDNQSARSLFLLCSLFPEDRNIPLEYLTFYGMGLSMFEGIRNLEEARNRAFTLVEMLKSRFLLLDGRDERHVKMHDVVRDVAIFTASKEGRVNLNSIDWSIEHSNCTWISVISKKGNDLPMRLIFRNLRLLLIDNSEEIELEMDDDFFEGMKGLNVLFLKSIWSRSLPQTIQLLKELRTLHLDSCTIDTISFVGELSNLEILCCRSCHWIEELPIELGSLDKLRFLEFSDCTSLKTIKPGIISRLVRLEELKMRGSFKRWEAEEKGKERRNIALKELQFLSNLISLEIEIGDCSLAAEKIFLSPKIAKYDIRIYGKWPKDISAHEKFLNCEERLV